MQLGHVNYMQCGTRSEVFAGWPRLKIGPRYEPFSKVSEPPEGQEQGGGAVGDQGIELNCNFGSTLFLTFRWVWDFLKWFQMIALAQKPGVSSMFLEASL